MPITDCQFNCTSLFWCHQTAMGSKVEKKLCCEFWWGCGGDGRGGGWRLLPSPLAGPGEAGEPTAQPWGIHLHNNAESAACLSLTKQIAWENDQVDAWQLSCYIRNPVLNTLYSKTLKFCVRVAPIMWKEMFPAVEWNKTLYIGSREGKDYYFLVLSVGKRSRQEVFLSAITRLGPTGHQHVSSALRGPSTTIPPHPTAGNFSLFCHNPQNKHKI